MTNAIELLSCNHQGQKSMKRPYLRSCLRFGRAGAGFAAGFVVVDSCSEVFKILKRKYGIAKESRNLNF
jgi:hypothetical protein